MEVEDAIADVQANEEIGGMTQDQAIQETLRQHPSIPGAAALRAVIAYAAARPHQLVP